MDKLDRIQKLHQLLISRRYPISLRALADKLDCSEKTTKRLIHVLEDLMLAPIEYNKEHKGWAYPSDPEAKSQLPGLWLTAEELQSIALLLHMLQNFGNGLLNEELKIVEKEVHKLLRARKISPEMLKNRIKILPIGHSVVPNNIYLRVSDALLKGKQLLLRYTDYSGKQSQRIVSPQDLVYYRDNWYLDAWCHTKNDIRQFLLARITKATINPEPANLLPVTELEAHFSTSYGIFGGKPKHTAILRFFGKTAQEVAQQVWNPEQNGQWHKDEYVLQFPYNDDRELLRDVMKHVPDVVVEGPAELQSALLERLNEGIRRLSDA